MGNPLLIAKVRQKYEALAPLLPERARRRWAACEARALGRGGISLVAQATGLSRPLIRRGLTELEHPAQAESPDPQPARQRRPGAGRRRLAVADTALLRDLRQLVDPGTRGDPMSPLLWTCKSTRNLAEALGGR